MGAMMEPEILTPYELFKEDVKAGLWNDTTYHYNEWLIANGYLEED